MSGFEIAGVVLGSVPLLISALEHYGNGIRTIKSIVGYKALVDNLALDFRVVNSSYRRSCEKLLIRLQLPPEDIDELLRHPKGPKWASPELDRHLQDLLRDDYIGYKQLVARVFMRLDRFSKKLGLSDDFKPKWIGKNGVEKPETRERFFRKTTGSWKAIMLGFDRDEYAGAIREIELDINRISSLVGDVIELEAPRRERNRSTNMRFWSSIRQYAANLFDSINWKCSCASDHSVNLRLEARKKADLKAEESYLFLVLFSFSPRCDPDSRPLVWRQAQIKPSEIPEPQDIARSESFAGPPPLPISGSKISSLCKALSLAPQTTSCIGFLDHHQCRHHIYSNCQDEERTIISLNQVLRAKNSARRTSYMRKYNYGIKERYQLSVTLASTVLQLHTTPWLHTAWSKDDIYFIIGSETSFVDHLYVRKPTTAQPVFATSHSIGPHPWTNPSLFALAVVLLELYFGCPIESIPSAPQDLDNQGNPHPFTKFLKVNRLAESIDKSTREQEGPYFTAIERCLRCNFDTRTWNLEDPQLQELFYLDVIAPLERCYEFMMCSPQYQYVESCDRNAHQSERS